jgi:hypothetical protein
MDYKLKKKSKYKKYDNCNSAKDFGNVNKFNKFNTLQSYTNKLEIDLKKEKVKSKFLRWGTGALLLCLGVVTYILK